MQVSYFWPVEREAVNEFEKKWHDATGRFGGEIISETISVMFGRYTVNIWKTRMHSKYESYNFFVTGHLRFLKAVKELPASHLSISVVVRYILSFCLVSVQSSFPSKISPLF